MDLNYIHNRFRQENRLSIIYPDVWIDWINRKAKGAGYRKYLTSGGAVYWNSLDEFSGGRLINTWDPNDHVRYVLTEYHWGNISHWTTNLNGDIAYNSYPTKLVPIITYRTNSQWRPTGRKQYYKVA